MSRPGRFTSPGHPLRNRDWPSTHGAQRCAELVADPDSLVLVAVADEEVVGHLVDTFAALSAMWVAPSW